MTTAKEMYRYLRHPHSTARRAAIGHTRTKEKPNREYLRLQIRYLKNVESNYGKLVVLRLDK